MRPNVSAGPPANSRRPARAGPTARAILKPTPLSAMACTRSLRGTDSAMTEPQAGLFIAAPRPMAKVSASKVQGPVWPRAVNTVSRIAAHSIQVCVPRISRRRSTISAMAPAGRASRNTGAMVAACTMLTISASGDIVAIIQPAPVFCIQTPSEATILAPQRVRNREWRKGLRAEGRAMAQYYPIGASWELTMP